MKRCCPIFFFPAVLAVILLQGCTATRISVEGIHLDKYLRTTEDSGRNFTGFLLMDPESGETLYSYHGNRFFTPASNTKIFTLYTSKKIIGDSIPSISTEILNDTLYFTGLGDPTFLHPDFDYQPAFNFLSSCKMPLVYVPGILYDNRFGPGWAWDDYMYTFSAERSSFPIYGNVVRIRKDNELNILPGVLTDSIRIVMDTAMRGNSGTIKASREEYGNRFSVIQNAHAGPFEVSLPFLSSHRLIRVLLEDTLRRKVPAGEKLPGIWKKIIFSQPVDSLLRPMMIDSDNFFAEQLLLMSAYVISDSLDAGKAIDYAETNIFPGVAEEMSWADGSGLSRYNKFTPRSVAEVLKMIYKDYGRDYIREIFPQGGVSGTMKNNFPDLKGIVWAKTGSMSNVYNLSGYLVTSKGRWLIFSSMNNHFTRSPVEVRKEIMKILLAISDRL